MWIIKKQVITTVHSEVNIKDQSCDLKDNVLKAYTAALSVFKEQFL